MPFIESLKGNTRTRNDSQPLSFKRLHKRLVVLISTLVQLYEKGLFEAIFFETVRPTHMRPGRRAAAADR